MYTEKCTKEHKQQKSENESKDVSVHQRYGRYMIFTLPNLHDCVHPDDCFLASQNQNLSSELSPLIFFWE